MARKALREAPLTDRATDLLGWTVRGTQRGVRLLDRDQGPQQGVIRAVAYRRGVFDVVSELVPAHVLGERHPLLVGGVRDPTVDRHLTHGAILHDAEDSPRNLAAMSEDS